MVSIRDSPGNNGARLGHVLGGWKPWKARSKLAEMGALFKVFKVSKPGILKSLHGCSRFILPVFCADWAGRSAYAIFIGIGIRCDSSFGNYAVKKVTGFSFSG
jgi:hypothetical protein